MSVIYSNGIMSIEKSSERVLGPVSDLHSYIFTSSLTPSGNGRQTRGK